MLKVHILDDQIFPHRSHVAHGVEAPAGARLLFTNGQVGTRLDGGISDSVADQLEVIFERLEIVLEAANMTFADVVRFDVFLTEQAYVDDFARVRDRVMGDHKPAATILIVKALAGPGVKAEIEAVAAKVD